MYPMIIVAGIFVAILTAGFVLRARGIKRLKAAVEKAGLTLESTDPVRVFGSSGGISLSFRGAIHSSRKYKHATTDFSAAPSGTTSRWVIIHRDWESPERLSIAGLTSVTTGSPEIDDIYLTYVEDEQCRERLASSRFHAALAAIPHEGEGALQELGITTEGSFTMVLKTSFISEEVLLPALELVSLSCA